MLTVTHSNWTEALIAVLGERLPRDPFVEATVVVPNRAMERVVEVGLARTRGLVVNVRFARLERWVEDELARPEVPFLSSQVLEGRLLAVLSDPALAEVAERDDPLAPVARYVLAADGRWSSAASDRRRLELAPRLAHLFTEYALTRPDWIRAWMTPLGMAALGTTERVQLSTEGPRGATERWQRALYLRARLLGEHRHVTLAEVLAQPEANVPSGDRGPVFVIGVSYVAPVFHQALAQIGRRRDLQLLVQNPCREFWADATKGASAAATHDEAESALLLSWGRPGREHVARLDESVGFDATTRFVDPAKAFTDEGVDVPVLQRVQTSLLSRTPVAAGAPDGSLVVLPCPGVRREVETVAQLAWGLVADADRRAREEGTEPLRLPEIAILVHAGERDTYLPHLEAVLGDGSEPEHLPWSAQDLSLAARSRVAEAALRLISFLGARPTRRELLALVAHPLVRPASLADEGTTEREWAELAERAGIVRGIDEGELAGTYAESGPGEAEVLHFDQGLRRLALGCALGSGSETIGAGTVGATEVARLETANVGARTEGAMTFVTLARSLLADHRSVGGARLSPSAWGLLLEALVAGYVRTESAAEERELERCRSALRGLASLDAPDPGTSGAEPGRYGAELALPLGQRALEGLSAIRGAPQSSGIVVASLLPMRAIPFRVVFLLGMGERLFPSERMDLGLDLRAGGLGGGTRRTGDVAPDERDRYAFLETLSSTRERLFLSYVARDEHTGDALGPSSVVTELSQACGGLLEARPPRRRHESLELDWLQGLGLDAPASRAAMTAALPAALAERAARARGDAEREHFRDVEVTSEAWARIEPDDARREELSLPFLTASQHRNDEGASVLVRLPALRRFLACPLQGRGAQWLGAEEEERTLLVAEEPLEAEEGTLTRVARDALSGALERGLGARPLETLEQALRAALREEQRCARVPVGALADGVLERAREQAEHWLGALLEARPGARHARGVRFGSVSLERARAEARLEARDALPLPALPAPRTGAARPALELVLEGRTRALLRAGETGPPGDVLGLVSGRSAGGSEAARLARWRAALDAYVDHAVLAAAGTERTARRAVLLCADGAYETALPALGRDAARRWLRTVAEDLLGLGPDGTTPHFMPVEAVLLEEEAVRRGDARLADKLGRAVERVRTKLEGGSSRYGPIRGATAYDAPEGADLVRLVARRHAAFLTSVRAPVRVGSGAAEGLLR